MRPLFPALLAASLCGCPGSSELKGTALLIETTVDAVEVDQLRYHGAAADGAAFEPAVRPEPAAGRIANDVTVRVLLPDARAGQTLTVQVDGLWQGM